MPTTEKKQLTGLVLPGKHGVTKILCSIDVTFFHLLFNGLLGYRSSENMLGRSSPNFPDRYTYGWAWSVRPSLSDRLRDVAMITNFWRESAKIGISALAFYNGREYCNTMTPLRLIKIGCIWSNNPGVLQAPPGGLIAVLCHTFIVLSWSTSLLRQRSRCVYAGII